VLLTREKLEQLSENELEDLYQKKRAEYDQKIAKNRRVRGLLARKVDEKQKKVEDIKNQISGFLEENPHLGTLEDLISGAIKQDFDDTHSDPEELKKTIQEKQKVLSQLQSKKMQIEQDIPKVSKHIEQQKMLEEQFQKEINSLISQNETLSDSESSELLELDQLSKDIQSAQDELEALFIEIEALQKEVYQQG
jgi:predicted  nucleic acid-binding Zn-ribbon protein